MDQIMSKPSISKRLLTKGDLRQIRPICRLLAGWFMALLLVMLASASPLHAASQSNIATGAWVGDPAYGEVRLVSAVSAMGDLEELPLGLEFRLAPGWKIYWRTPGEAG